MSLDTEIRTKIKTALTTAFANELKKPRIFEFWVEDPNLEKWEAHYRSAQDTNLIHAFLVYFKGIDPPVIVGKFKKNLRVQYGVDHLYSHANDSTTHAKFIENLFRATKAINSIKFSQRLAHKGIGFETGPKPVLKINSGLILYATGTLSVESFDFLNLT